MKPERTTTVLAQVGGQSPEGAWVDDDARNADDLGFVTANACRPDLAGCATIAPTAHRNRQIAALVEAADRFSVLLAAIAHRAPGFDRPQSLKANVAECGFDTVPEAELTRARDQHDRLRRCVGTTAHREPGVRAAANRREGRDEATSGKSTTESSRVHPRRGVRVALNQPRRGDDG